MDEREYQAGDRVEVDIAAGITPAVESVAEWKPGTVIERLPSGLYRIRLLEPIGGREAEKEARPEHIRGLA